MARHDNKTKTILYADYSERNIKAVRSAVGSLGFGDFIQCDDRDRTIRLIDERKPDLVLIGLYLDGIRGISTIRAIRDSATDDKPHGRNVPILLGAPKLDRRGMRDAVNAGIEGVFRQPVDPERLTKIIETVLKNPRRFVLEDNYFGPARPQDLAKMHSRSFGKAHGTAPSAPARASTTLKSGTTIQAPSKPLKSPSAVGIAPNPDLKEARVQLNGAGQTFNADELSGTTAAQDQGAINQNIQALHSAREVLDPAVTQPQPQPSAPADTAIKPEETPKPADEELVEINLQEALASHKLWVDTGGREGAIMSVDHADLRDADLEGIDLSRCSLPFASFQRANCKDVVLRRCNLTAADFVESNLDNANLAASRLAGARFDKAKVRNTVFLGSDLSRADFRGLQLQNCDLSGTNLAGTDFRDADLSGTRGLFAEQIQRARVNANTRLPRDLKLSS